VPGAHVWHGYVDDTAGAEQSVSCPYRVERLGEMFQDVPHDDSVVDISSLARVQLKGRRDNLQSVTISDLFGNGRGQVQSGDGVSHNSKVVHERTASRSHFEDPRWARKVEKTFGAIAADTLVKFDESPAPFRKFFAEDAELKNPVVHMRGRWHLYMAACGAP